MNELLSLGELAECLDIPLAWLREEFEAGRIPHLDAGGTCLFNPLVVRETLASRAKQTLKARRNADE